MVDNNNYDAHVAVRLLLQHHSMVGVCVATDFCTSKYLKINKNKKKITLYIIKLYTYMRGLKHEIFRYCYENSYADTRVSLLHRLTLKL